MKQDPLYSGQTDSDGLPHGQGKMTFVDNSVYEGQFVHGQKEGIGEFKRQDGFSYEGNWVNGQRHGKGKQIDVDGSTIEGEWKDNRLNGEGYITQNKGTKKKVLFYNDVMVPV